MSPTLRATLDSKLRETERTISRDARMIATASIVLSVQPLIHRTAKEKPDARRAYRSAASKGSPMTTYDLYSISGAPRPWRVLLGLVAKGLDFNLHTLDASKKEHKSARILALNPRGRVPILKIGERVFTESLAILAYLDEVHAEPPLFGTTPEEHARIWQLASEAEHDVNDACAALTRPLFFHGKDDSDEDVRRAATLVRDELTRLDGLVAISPFLAGSRITAADCVCFPHVRLIVRATERFPEVMRRLELHPFDGAFPHLARWVARIEALPGYERTFPPHWKV